MQDLSLLEINDVVAENSQSNSVEAGLLKNILQQHFHHVSKELQTITNFPLLLKGGKVLTKKRDGHFIDHLKEYDFKSSYMIF